MGQQNIVFAGKGHGLFHKGQICHGPGGIVGIVEPHELGSGCHIGRYGLQIGQKAVFRQQGHGVAGAAGQQGAAAVYRIGRVRHQGDIPGIDKAVAEVGDALFGADQGHHLGDRVDILYSEAGGIIVGHCLTEGQHALRRRIAVVFHVAG